MAVSAHRWPEGLAEPELRHTARNVGAASINKKWADSQKRAKNVEANLVNPLAYEHRGVATSAGPETIWNRWQAFLFVLRSSSVLVSAASPND